MRSTPLLLLVAALLPAARLAAAPPGAGGAGAAPPPTPDPAGDTAPDAPPAGEVQPVTGSLAIRAVQGTPGGPPIGAAEVIIDLVHRGNVIFTREATLDEHGVLVIDDLPIAADVQPVVRVEHANVTYQTVGEAMGPSNPEQMLEVTCYEITNEIPEWAISMRHVILMPSPRGLAIQEVVVVQNPEERSWIGVEGAGDKPLTTSFFLPENAAEVQLGRGFHDWCCTTHDGRNLVNHLPLMPGTTEFSFGYLLPVVEGRVRVDLEAVKPVEHLMVMMPPDMSFEEVSGLQIGGTQSVGSATVRALTAGPLDAGAKAGLTVMTVAASGAPGALGATPAVTAEPGSSRMLKVAVAIGAGLILLIAIVLIFAKSPRSAPAE